jgi:hypothetical protein
MKTIIAFLTLALSVFALNTQAQSNLNGSWTFKTGDTNHLLLIQDGFYFHTVYKSNQFLRTNGAQFDVSGKVLKAKILFNSADSVNVNKEVQLPFSLANDKLHLETAEGKLTFNRLDENKAPLAGVWKITGRMQSNGEVAPIHQKGTRHTYKLLTGTKFQWVAIDPGKKEFSGTGGGSYTFKDGKYTEHIEFFSRDNSRVGAALSFDGKLENGDWHHSGLSSKGAKIYEVWSKR